MCQVLTGGTRSAPGFTHGWYRMDYARIAPFPGPGAYASMELRALASVWLERRAALENNGAYKDFIRRLQREWAIETGIIERLYTWDRGVTEVLIERGIEASIIAHRSGVDQLEAEHITEVITDHLKIIDGLFAYIKGDEPLTEYFIRGLEAQFTEHQEYTDAHTPTGERVRVSLLRGEYKTAPNSPRRPDGEVHAYCPPEFTKEEMERLISLYREAESQHAPEVRAAWLHHRFTQIHPFQDGNGRVARALASLVFLRDGLFPLVVRDSDRTEYIGALEAADAGELGPLADFFARRQRDSILTALGLEQQAQQNKRADVIIQSALELLKGRYSRDTQRIAAVYEHAEKLLEAASARLGLVAGMLNEQLEPLTPPGRSSYAARANHAANAESQRHYFQKQIADIASQFGYYANFEQYRAWARVTLSTDFDFDYVVSVHGYGPGDTGIMVVSAFTYTKAPVEDGGTEIVGLKAAAEEFFQFNYVEPFESTLARFEDWLEASVATAMAEWKRSLQ